jgi:hypothetical protein
MRAHSSRLIHLLIGKSVVEALLVTGVSVAFYFDTTNPYLRGWLDQADNQSVAGWVVDKANPATRVEVQLFVDGQFAGDRSASEFRPDVHAANRADDDWHGFSFKTPLLQNGEHEARVYAVYVGFGGARRTLQLIGKPLRFQIDGSITQREGER